MLNTTGGGQNLLSTMRCVGAGVMPSGVSNSGSERGAGGIAAVSGPSYYVIPGACCSKDGQRFCQMHAQLAGGGGVGLVGTAAVACQLCIGLPMKHKYRRCSEHVGNAVQEANPRRIALQPDHPHPLSHTCNFGPRLAR